MSVYKDHVEYVKSICTQLGFEFSIDKLRIPSTKRTCLVAHGRVYESANYAEESDARLEAVISSQKCNFVSRSNVEEVRNCTKIDKSVTSRIYDAISAKLIERQMMRIIDEDVWSADYSISFKEAVDLLNAEDLLVLKRECGGLQTLLRNNHSVYLIREGRILFRKPSETTNRKKWKNRLCWFYHNHPLRCPLQEEKCSFIH